MRSTESADRPHRTAWQLNGSVLTSGSEIAAAAIAHSGVRTLPFCLPVPASQLVPEGGSAYPVGFRLVPPVSRTPPDGPLQSPLPLLGAVVLLFVLGLVLGIFGALLIPAGPRIGSVLLSVGVAVALIGNLTSGVLGMEMTGNRLGAIVPGIGWLVAVLPLGAKRPEGDLIVTGDTKGYAFLLAGLLSSVLVIALAPLWTARRR